MATIKVGIPKAVDCSGAVVVYFLCGESAQGIELSAVDDGSEFVITASSAEIRASDALAAKAIARHCPDLGLLGTGPIEETEVDWICSLAEVPDEGLDALLVSLDTRLIFRSFLVGYRVTVADCAMWARLSRSGREVNGVHLKRWLHHIEGLEAIQQAKKFMQDNAGPAGEWADVLRLVKSQGQFEVVKLPGVAMGNVCTRFPPEPSGYLHIGHAKAALLNDYLARTMQGRLILRFDDTNPVKEKSEFEENILADLERLGIRPDVVEYTSDYFEALLEMATKWLKEGKAYIDKTPVEEMRAQRMNFEESTYRSQSVEENLRLWEEMKKGSEEGLQCAARAKIDMKSKNGAMRDPIIFRCIPDAVHHRTGDKYKLYPSYDFACPIVDSMEDVTHALRSSEYVDREIQYYWMCDAAGLRKPHMWDFSRLNFKYAVLSKRKLQWFVDNKIVDGWADPRFPTVQGIRRRGMTIQALRAFILSQGASKNTNLMEWDKIWTVNKRVIDPVAPRHTAISASNYCELHVENATEEVKTAPKHKKNPDVGTKSVIFSKVVMLEKADAESVAEGEIVTLMDWGNVRVFNVADGQMKGEFLPDNTDFKKTKKFTWLAKVPDLAPAKLQTFGHLITVPKLEDDQKLEDVVNHDSKHEEDVLCDINVKLLQQGDIIQFERRGYFICDSVLTRENGKPMTFVYIPDGRTEQASAK